MPDSPAWKEASGKAHHLLKPLKEKIKNYSYSSLESSLLTDERLCEYIQKSLSRSRKTLFSISDICFSTHTGSKIISLAEKIRDELEIFSDEIHVRHCVWKDVPPDFLQKIIRQDHSLLDGIDNLVKNLESCRKSIISSIGKKPGKDFWEKIQKSLLKSKSQARDLAIQFKEREAMCNIRAIALEKTFQKMREEIRRSI